MSNYQAGRSNYIYSQIASGRFSCRSAASAVGEPGRHEAVRGVFPQRNPERLITCLQEQDLAQPVPIAIEHVQNKTKILARGSALELEHPEPRRRLNVRLDDFDARRGP